MKLIVDGYVRLRDRKKIEELREHRQRLRNALKDKSSDAFDTSYLSRLLDSELEVIEAGLTSLQ